MGWISLSVLLIVALFSGGAVAEAFVDLESDDLNGQGTEDNPYQIGNASELQAISKNLSANYELVGTIEAGNTSA